MRALRIGLFALALLHACDSDDADEGSADPELATAPVTPPEPQAPPREATALCTSDGWCVEDLGYATLPHLRGTGDSPYHVVGAVAYVLTAAGVVRYDGDTWTLEALAVEEPWGIGGPAEGEPIVLGRDGTVVERDDGEWRVAHEGSIPGAILDDVWIRGTDNCWAEVLRDDRSRQLMHWDGSEWSAPEPLADVEDARGLAPVSPDWAVVLTGSGDARQAMVVEHSEVGGWTARVTEGDPVDGVWVGPDDRVLGVRGDSVLRLLDTRWETVHREPSIRGFRFVTGGGERVVAIGQGRAEAGDVDTARLRRVLVGDGDTWSLSGPMGVMIDRAFVLPDEVVVSSLEEGVFVRTSEGWRAHARLNAVWAHASDAVYAVGDDGAIRRFDGERWRAEDSGTTEDLLGVHGFDAETVVAVGRAGVVLRRTDAGWTRELSGVAHDLLSVYGASPDALRATAAEGPGIDNPYGLARRDGAWARLDDGGLRHAQRVVAGPGGRPMGVGGRALSGPEGLPDRTPRAVFDAWLGASGGPTTSSPRYYALGRRGVYRHDGDAWTLEDLPGLRQGASPLAAIHGAGPSPVVAGSTGQIWERVDDAWVERRLPSRRALTDVFALPTGEAWAVGEGGLILRRPAP